MTAKSRDVCLSLVQAAKDDVTKYLRVARDPNSYQARAVEHLQKLIEVYAAVEEELRNA